MPPLENVIGYGVAGGTVALVGFLASLVAMRYAIIYMPADYFVREPGAGPFHDRHPALYWSFMVLKNLLGVALLLAGVTMLITPGPGILLLLVGLSLVNVPGKRQLELRLLKIRSVKNKIDGLRKKHQQPELQLPAEEERKS